MSSGTTVSERGAESSAHASVEGDGYVPLKERFRAWWNGNDSTGTTHLRRATASLAIEHSGTDDEPPWSPARIRAIEAVWGTGFLLPGGGRFARKLLAVLAVSSKKSVLDLTADLGGTARALANQHNLWMDAFEPIERLATEGHRRSVIEGLAKRVPVTAINFDTFELPPRRYDAIYSRERLFTVSNKDRVLDQCVIGLKDRGQVLLTDFMLPERIISTRTDTSLRRTGETPHLWTMRQYRAAFEARGLLVRLANDLSSDYLQLMHDAWSKAPEAIRRERMSRRQVDLIMEEGGMWLARSRAMRDGKLVLGRIHAQLDKVE